MGSMSRTKGHSWEREAAADFRLVYSTAKRGIGQSRGGGAELPDVDGTPFHVECKRGKRVNVRAAVAQAKRDTRGRPPLVVLKEDHTAPLAVLPWDELLVLLLRVEHALSEGAARALVTTAREARAAKRRKGAAVDELELEKCGE